MFLNALGSRLMNTSCSWEVQMTDVNELSNLHRQKSGVRTIFLKNDGKFLKIRQTKLASCRQYKTNERGLKIILSTFKNVCPSLNFENRPSLCRLIKDTCHYGHI